LLGELANVGLDRDDVAWFQRDESVKSSDDSYVLSMLIANKDNTMVLLGAGASAEAGVPMSFRDDEENHSSRMWAAPVVAY
jgi:hypothetical protein